MEKKGKFQPSSTVVANLITDGFWVVTYIAICFFAFRDRRVWESADLGIAVPVVVVGGLCAILAVSVIDMKELLRERRRYVEDQPTPPIAL